MFIVKLTVKRNYFLVKNNNGKSAKYMQKLFHQIPNTSEQNSRKSRINWLYKKKFYNKLYENSISN